MHLPVESAISNVSAFLKQKNLARQPLKYNGKAALFVIDVQKEFCDPNGFRGNKETNDVSKRIQSLVPEFRNAEVPVYVIYYSDRRKDASHIDFYKFKPVPGDILTNKYGDSAFKSSNIKKTLEKDGIKSLLVCGFNLSSCVKKTAIDARMNDFNVCVLKDLTGNDDLCSDGIRSTHILEMLQDGVMLKKSSTVLKYINTQKNAAAVPTI